MNSSPSAAPPFPRLPVRAGLADAWAGARLPIQAMGLIVSTPRLLGLSLLAALVTGTTLVAAGVWLWGATGHWSEGWIDGDGAWGRAGAGAVHVVLFVAAWAVSALTLPNVVLSPLQDPLSEATEARCGVPPEPGGGVRGFVTATLSSLWHTVARLAVMLLGLAVLLPLHLVPVAGSALWMVLSSIWTAFWIAVEHTSTPASRRRIPFSLLIRVLGRRPFLALGLGGVLSVLLWVPVVNFLLLPVAVVAGTLLFLALSKQGLLPGPGTPE